jgi:branched-chain amino acid aminotransferase
MPEMGMIAWIDGRLEPIENAWIDPRDRGFTLGDGLYETIRAKDRAPLRLDRHFARLNDGLRVLDIPLKLDEVALTEAMRAVLAGNGLADGVVRLTVSRGVGARGLPPDPASKPTAVITAAPYHAPAPGRAMIATVTRRNHLSPLSRIKVTSCADAILARIEATQAGFDDAILLNGSGLVAEATAANLFAVIDGILVTPPIRDGALPGVMRAAIMELLAVEERSLTPSDLARANELFLTTSLGIRPLTGLGERALQIGETALALRDL